MMLQFSKATARGKPLALEPPARGQLTNCWPFRLLD